MGEAKRRGSYEKRMTEAIAYGRKKKPKVKPVKFNLADHNLPLAIALSVMQRTAFRRIKR